MIMTKKDYELIARALRIARMECKHDDERAGVVIARIFIAAELKLDNPNFDKMRFEAACDE